MTKRKYKSFHKIILKWIRFRKKSQRVGAEISLEPLHESKQICNNKNDRTSSTQTASLRNNKNPTANDEQTPDYLSHENKVVAVKFLLHVAVFQQNVEWVKNLMAQDAFLNALDQHQLKDLLFLHNFDRPDSDDKIETLKILLNHHNTSLYDEREDGESLMEYFFKYGDRRTREAVIKSNVDLFKICGRNGGTALHYLLLNEKINSVPKEEINLLLSRGFDVNMRDKKGMTALMRSVMNSLEEVAEFLMEIGAEVSWQDIVMNKYMLSAFIYQLPSAKYYQKILEFIIYQQLNTSIQSIYQDLNKGSTNEADNFFFAQIVIAHLVFAEAHGQSLRQPTSNSIEYHNELKEYYNFCKATIKDMSITTLNGSMTLLELFTKSDDEIDMYIRNKGFILELNDILNQERYKNEYYAVIIRKRFEYATRMMELRKKSGRVICELTGLYEYGVDENHYILYKILNRKDIKLFQDN